MEILVSGVCFLKVFVPSASILGAVVHYTLLTENLQVVFHLTSAACFDGNLPLINIADLGLSYFFSFVFKGVYCLVL